MEPWYRVAMPRAEVREGRSFHPDEFAIALEQVVRGAAPEDYSDPAKFFSRNVMGDGHENMIFSLLTPSMCSRS